jgi:hypothetical protein
LWGAPNISEHSHYLENFFVRQHKYQDWSRIQRKEARRVAKPDVTNLQFVTAGVVTAMTNTNVGYG